MMSATIKLAALAQFITPVIQYDPSEIILIRWFVA